MDILTNVNTIVSIIVGCTTTISTIIAAIAKRGSVQRTIENPSTPIDIRIRLEDQWSGGSFIARIINGVIGSVLVAVIMTLVVTFLVNFFLAWPVVIHDMSTLSSASNYPQAQGVFQHMLSIMGQILSFTNPVALIIGAVVGLLVGISMGVSTISGGRRMSTRRHGPYTY